MNRYKSQTGFTLVQLIITSTIIVILGTAAYIWIDPVAKIGQAKNERRRHDVMIIANAINDYANNHKGVLPILGAVTTDKKVLCESQGGSLLTCGASSQYCLKVDSKFLLDFLPQLPLDPDKTANTDTGYYLQKDSNNKLVVGACSQYGSTAITYTLNLKVTCDAYAGGYCWYNDGNTDDCDTVCASVGKTCIKNATYDSDTLCLLSDASSGDYNCSVDCAAIPSGDEPPFISDDNSCGYATGIFSCSQASSYGLSICPCE